jgi:hypothetical protein
VRSAPGNHRKEFKGSCLQISDLILGDTTSSLATGISGKDFLINRIRQNYDTHAENRVRIIGAPLFFFYLAKNAKAADLFRKAAFR